MAPLFLAVPLGVRRLRSGAPVTRYWMPAGDLGVYTTLAAMRAQARAAATHPTVQLIARNVAGATPADTWAALHQWLTTRTQFQPDPPGAEDVRTPLEQLKRIGRDGVMHGDCDDVATLGAAIAVAAGLRVRYVVLGFFAPGPAAPFRHVYAEVATPCPGGTCWRDLDVTRKVTSPAPTRRATVDV